MKLTVPILWALVYLLCVITGQAVRRLPIKELHQRSRSGDETARRIYQLAQAGAAGRFMIWLLGLLSLSILYYLSFQRHWWLGVIAVALTGTLVGAWHPVRQAKGLNWSLAGWMSWGISYWLALIKPLPEKFNNLASRFHHANLPTGLYEKQDLLELLKGQSDQPDNRIDDRHLHRASRALEFSDKTVGQIMIPKDEIKWLEVNEPISPGVMDELHQTGQRRFPLVKDAEAAKPEILGSLYIGDLLKHLDKKAKLKDIMREGVFYLNESSSLEQALGAHLKTGSLLLIVINGREEIVGLLPIEKLLVEGLGNIKFDDFNDYEDSRLAADHEPYETLE